jgi:hypothetical protein
MIRTQHDLTDKTWFPVLAGSSPRDPTETEKALSLSSDESRDIPDADIRVREKDEDGMFYAHKHFQSPQKDEDGMFYAHKHFQSPQGLSERTLRCPI